MEEHRFACPTHVREFTRFRGHFNPTLDATPDTAPADEPAPPAPPGEPLDDPRPPGAATAPGAR